MFQNIIEAMSRNGITSEAISDCLGLSTEDLDEKLTGLIPWELTEAKKLVNFLKAHGVATTMELLFEELPKTTYYND